MWHSLHELIPKAAGKYHLQPTLKAFDIFRAYQRIAPTLFPSDWEKHVSARSYKDAIFTLTVKNSMWSQQLMMKKHLIQEYINGQYGKNTVKKITVILVEDDVEKPLEAC